MTKFFVENDTFVAVNICEKVTKAITFAILTHISCWVFGLALLTLASLV